MQNLNQIRARHVLEFAKSEKGKCVQGKNGGEVIKKIPPVILNNGIMAALAYSMGLKKRDEETGRDVYPWRNVFDAIAQHLASAEIEMIPSDQTSAESLLKYLATIASSVQLRDITAEAFEWLNFARRLVSKE